MRQNGQLDLWPCWLEHTLHGEEKHFITKWGRRHRQWGPLFISVITVTAVKAERPLRYAGSSLRICNSQTAYRHGLSSGCTACYRSTWTKTPHQWANCCDAGNGQWLEITFLPVIAAFTGALFHQVNIFCFDGILIHFWDTIAYSVSPNSVLEYVFRTKYDRISMPHLEYYSISAGRSTF